ncbi:MAG: DUF2071 domain-containing protein [Verrucomicrobiales bacterium]|nr:DUF2071 domain-containing protein [Verrucomicrobiales bacterium]
MTVLHDLYRLPKAKRVRGGGSEESQRQSLRPTSAEARHAMEDRFAETVLLSDWVDFVFIHFEVDRDLLQQVVPFPVDTYEGKAFVSLVAFTMKRMRPAFGGKATGWILRPIASHQFLNLRTYVNLGGQTGIFFMEEWLNEKFAVILGPKTFGLPYHYASVDYLHDEERCACRVLANEGEICFSGRKNKALGTVCPGSRDDFLLERYTAFTAAGRKPHYFRVWHPSWKIGAVDHFELTSRVLLSGLRELWTDTAIVVGTHWSPGVFDVRMGRPHSVG